MFQRSIRSTNSSLQLESLWGFASGPRGFFTFYSPPHRWLISSCREAYRNRTKLQKSLETLIFHLLRFSEIANEYSSKKNKRKINTCLPTILSSMIAFMFSFNFNLVHCCYCCHKVINSLLYTFQKGLKMETRIPIIIISYSKKVRLVVKTSQKLLFYSFCRFLSGGQLFSITQLICDAAWLTSLEGEVLAPGAGHHGASSLISIQATR